MASGIVAEPYVIRAVVRVSGEVVAATEPGPSRTAIDPAALSLIQEGLRGVVRLPTGTAHALATRGFPIAVMGDTGTTDEFRDAIFVGSTYGPDGITAAVRIGFDDNRSLGSRQTEGDKLPGAAPAFPASMENRITASLLAPFLLRQATSRATPSHMCSAGSGRTMARSGLRMMPTSPSSPLESVRRVSPVRLQGWPIRSGTPAHAVG